MLRKLGDAGRETESDRPMVRLKMPLRGDDGGEEPVAGVGNGTSGLSLKTDKFGCCSRTEVSTPVGSNVESASVRALLLLAMALVNLAHIVESATQMNR